MSMKINKNGKEYPVGTIPQNVIDDVTELKANKKISPNTTDITSYNTSANQYQFPTDGYVFKGGVTTINQSCLIRYDDLISTRFVPTSVNDADVDYVRKGMRAYIQANGAGCTILFYPLVSR